MSAGAEWRAEVRKALAELHRQQRNRRGRRAKGLERADVGRLGLRIPPPQDTGTGEEAADATP
jgi:hypothetical protein